MHLFHRAIPIQAARIFSPSSSQTQADHLPSYRNSLNSETYNLTSHTASLRTALHLESSPSNPSIPTGTIAAHPNVPRPIHPTHTPFARCPPSNPSSTLAIDELLHPPPQPNNHPNLTTLPPNNPAPPSRKRSPASAAHDRASTSPCNPPRPPSSSTPTPPSTLPPWPSAANSTTKQQPYPPASTSLSPRTRASASTPSH